MAKTPNTETMFVKKLPHYVGEDLKYATEGSACLDIPASITANTTIPTGQTTLIPTGLSVAIPVGHVGLVFARSGNALHKGLMLVNGVGVIDSDYRGELRVPLTTNGLTHTMITPGERIAQLMILKLPTINVVYTTDLPPTARGDNGFGSTG